MSALEAASRLDTLTVLRLLHRELNGGANGDGAGVSEPDELLHSVVQSIHELSGASTVRGTPATPLLMSVKRGNHQSGRSYSAVPPSAHNGSAFALTEGTQVPDDALVVERATIIRLQRELEAARLNAARFEKRAKELAERCRLLETELKATTSSSAWMHDTPEARERELRMLCQELARAEARARGEATALRQALACPADVRLAQAQREVEHLRAQLNGDAHGLHQPLSVLAQADGADGAAQLAPMAAGEAEAARAEEEASPTIATPGSKALDRALSGLADTQARQSPLPAAAPIVLVPEPIQEAASAAFVPAELSEGDVSASQEEQEEEDDTNGTEEAVANAEAALHAAQTEAARLEQQEKSVRTAAELQATDAMYEEETARSASAALAAAASALSVQDPNMRPKIWRQLHAAKVHAEEEAARARRGAHNAAEAARTASAAARAAGEAAAFARATANAKALALQRCLAAQRRRADHAAKCRALMGQTEKLAASLRTERAAWERCHKEAEGLVAVLQASNQQNAIAGVVNELEMLRRDDVDPDFPPRGPLPRQRADVIMALAAERDRMSSQLAHVQGLHEAGSTIVRRLSARLETLKAKAAGGDGKAISAAGIGERFARLF